MYRDILESIEKLELTDDSRKLILMENCLEHIFSLNPFRIMNCEYYKRYVDWKKLKKQDDKKNISDIKQKMLSDFYKTEINNIKSTNGDISLLKEKFTVDDIKIVLAIKTLNSQVWLNRVGTLWANLLAILSLAIAIIAILIKDC